MRTIAKISGVAILAAGMTWAQAPDPAQSTTPQSSGMQDHNNAAPGSMRRGSMMEGQNGGQQQVTGYLVNASCTQLQSAQAGSNGTMARNSTDLTATQQATTAQAARGGNRQTPEGTTIYGRSSPTGTTQAETTQNAMTPQTAVDQGAQARRDARMRAQTDPTTAPMTQTDPSQANMPMSTPMNRGSQSMAQGTMPSATPTATSDPNRSTYGRQSV